MAFEVSIKITAESQLEAVKAAEAAVQRVGATAKQVAAQSANLNLLGPGLIETVKGSGRAAAAVAGLGVKAQQLRPLIATAAAELGGMSKGASLASSGLSALILGGLTPAGVALAAGVIAMGAWSNAAATAAEKAKALEEIEKNFAAGVKASTERLTDLTTATAQVGRDRLTQIDIQRKAALAKVDKDLAATLLAPGFRDEDEGAFFRRESKRNAAARERAAIEKAVSEQITESHRQELSVIGRMDAVLASNTLRRKENELQIAQQAKASEQVIQALEREMSAAQKRVKDIDFAEKAARGGDVGAVFEKQIQALNKNLDSLARQQFPEAFQFDNVAAGFKGLAALAREVFGISIPASLQASIDKGSDLTRQLGAEKGFEIKADAGDALGKIAEVRGELAKLPSEKAISLKMNLGGAGRGAIRPGQTKFTQEDLGVPDKVETEWDWAGSPTLPFSEYVSVYAPRKIAELADKVKATDFTVDTNLSGLVDKAMDRLLFLNSRLADFTFGDRRGFSPTFGDAILAERRGIFELVGAFSGRAGGPSTSSGQGGGGITINNTFDFSNSVVTRDAMDTFKRDLIPAIEDAARMAAGKTLGIRTLN